MSTPQNPADTQAARIARVAGQLLGGFVVGVLVVTAVIEIYGQAGNMHAFEYQGY